MKLNLYAEALYKLQEEAEKLQKQTHSHYECEFSIIEVQARHFTEEGVSTKHSLGLELKIEGGKFAPDNTSFTISPINSQSINTIRQFIREFYYDYDKREQYSKE